MTPSLTQIRQIGHRLSGGSIRRESVSTELAKAFGWSSENLRATVVEDRGRKFPIIRAFSSGQPAAIFVASSGQGIQQELATACEFGYHSAVRWGLFADRRGISAFNCNWIHNDDWLILPLIDWTNVSNFFDYLESFTPQGVLSKRLDEYALEKFYPVKFLRPVDDILVARLDYWREEALRFSESENHTDEQLQLLYSQFFVLRIVEDRGLAARLPALSAAIAQDDRSVDRTQLKKIYQVARSKIGEELFSKRSYENFSNNVLFGIINDLYSPQGGPSGFKRYNFAWMDADVLGSAYEKYISSVLLPKEPLPQFELFDQPLRGVEKISVRKAAGAYYTPSFLSKYLTEVALEKYFDRNGASSLPRVIDFACGSGSFLTAALDGLLRRLRATDKKRNWARELIESGCIQGIDIDERAVTMARLNVWQRLTEEPMPLPLPKLTKYIRSGDALRKETWKRTKLGFHIALGNPPFLATPKVASRSYLEANFKTAKGRFDFAHLFIEKGISILEENGIGAFVVPNRIFRNKDASILRAELSEKSNVAVVLDFESLEIFEGTSAYIGGVIFRVKSARPEERQSTRALIVKNIGSNLITQRMLLATFSSANISDSYLSAFSTELPEGGAPWVLIPFELRQLRTRLQDSSERLETIAGIFQGIRTGANDIFIVSADDEGDARFVRVINGFGEQVLLERTFLRPMVYGSDVQRYEIVNPSRYLIYPYRPGVPLSEAALEKEAPLTYKYLSKFRELLSQRAGISDGTYKWFELVRRRTEQWLTKPKLLIRDLSPETAFAADPRGIAFLAGGTAVVPNETELLFPLLGYLNTSIASNYLKVITPQFRGNFQKFEPQHLAALPVPNFIAEGTDESAKISELARKIVSEKTENPENNNTVGLEEEIEKIIKACI
jgi:type I restriction-modification system DNA methylase subunit